MTNVFVARQPIFSIDQEIYGYEILYRSGFGNVFGSDTDPDVASSRVILDTFQNFGLQNITNAKPAFINFPDNLIKEGVATLFPKESLVIELLETVSPSPEIVAEVRLLKKAGYTIALDDFVYSPAWEPLLDSADIVKVDFLKSRPKAITDLKACLGNREIVLLAEKVETWTDFDLARELGFTLFQGYFFAKPEVLNTNSLTPLEINHFELVAKVNEERMDFTAISEIISRDLSLTYNLLKLVNSAAFYRRGRINSVQHALIMLGELEIRKWVTLIALQGMSMGKITAPVALSMVRGRFAELLGEKAKLEGLQRGELFLVGLFSLLDVLLQRPMALIVEELAISDAVKEALLYRKGPLGKICGIVRAYEQAAWTDLRENVEGLNLDCSTLSAVYLEAIQWQPFLQDVG